MKFVNLWKEFTICLLGILIYCITAPPLQYLGLATFIVGVCFLLLRIVTLRQQTKQSWLASFYRNICLITYSLVFGVTYSLIYFWKRHLLILAIFSLITITSYFSPFIGVISSTALLLGLAIYNIILLGGHSKLSRMLLGIANNQDIEDLSAKQLFKHPQNYFSYHAIWVNIFFILTAGLLFRGIAFSFPEAGWYSYNDQGIFSWFVFAIDEILFKGALTFDIMEKYSIHVTRIVDVADGAKALSIFFRFLVSVFLIKIVLDELNFHFTVASHVKAMERIKNYEQRREDKSYLLLESFGQLAYLALKDGLYDKSETVAMGCSSLLTDSKAEKQLLAFVEEAIESNNKKLADPVAAALISLRQNNYPHLIKLTSQAINLLAASPQMLKTVFDHLNTTQYQKAEHFSYFSSLAETIPRAALPGLFRYLNAIDVPQKLDFFERFLNAKDPQNFGEYALLLAQADIENFLPQYFLAATICDPHLVNQLTPLLKNFGLDDHSLVDVQNLQHSVPETRLTACQNLTTQFDRHLHLVYEHFLDDKAISLRRLAAKNIAIWGSKKQGAKLAHIILNDSDAYVRKEAAKAIAALELKEYGSQLLQAFHKDPDEEVRSYIAEFIGILNLAEYSNDIAQVLIGDESKDICKSVVNALGILKAKQCGEQLVHALQNSQWFGVRKCAAEVIAKLNLKQYDKYLVAALEDRHEIVRGAAAKAIAKLKLDQYAEHLIQALKNEQQQSVRSEIVFAIALLGNKDIAEQLLQIKETEQSDEVRCSIVHALTELKLTQYSDQFVSILKNDSSEKVRIAAIEAFEKLNLPQYCAQLETATKTDNNFMVRRAAIETLTALKIAKPSLLLEILKDESSSDVRITALKAIAQLDFRECAQDLANYAIHDDNATIRSCAIRTIAQLKLKQHGDLLVTVFEQDNNNQVRCAVAESLVQLKLPEQFNQIASSFSKQEEDVASAILKGIGSLELHQYQEMVGTAFTESEDFSVRCAAITAIADLKLTQYENLLAQAMSEDEDEDVRKAATFAIGKMGIYAFASKLARTLTEDNYFEVRRAAALTIGQLHLKKLAINLVSALEDEHDDVASAATQALTMLDQKEYCSTIFLHFNTSHDTKRRLIETHALAILGKTKQDLQVIYDKENDEIVKAALANAIAVTGDKLDLDPLLEVWQQEHNHIMSEFFSFVIGIDLHSKKDAQQFWNAYQNEGKPSYRKFCKDYSTQTM